MENKTRAFKIDFHIDWEYGVEIKKIKEDLQALENLGATHIEIDVVDSFGSSYLQIEAFSHRLETNEELTQRIEEERIDFEKNKAIDLNKIAELKAKHGIQ